ncbi:MAG: prolipoprotein diacylglyceryl transferase [Candidatus Avispirillum sp.]
MFEVSFPGFGLGPIEIHKVAFQLFDGKIQVTWYGILIAVGMILAFFYAMSRAKFEGIKSDDMIDLALFILIFSIIGARLYYVIFPPKGVTYLVTDGGFWHNVGQTLLNVVSVWEGGLAIFGGLIAGFIVTFLVARHKKIRLPVLLDTLAPSLLLAQSVGRWGNFMNGEAYGYETDVIWRMGLKTTSGYIEVHPTFLYESLWNIIGFAILAIFYKKKKFNGQIFYFYMIWYGLGRAFIEGMRTDSLPLWGLTDFSGNPIRVSQALAALIFIAGVALMVFFWVNASKAKKTTVAAEVSAEAAVSAADGNERAAVTEDENSADSDENVSESDSDSDGGETDTEENDNEDK